MRRRARMLAGLVVAAAALTAMRAVPAAPVDQASADEDAVRSVVQAYFDGMMQASPETLREAFHPSARLIGAGPYDTYRIIPFKEWASTWEGQEPLGPDGYVNRIVSVDIHGSAASVKTELTWPDVIYVDYLSLVRVGGEWKIVNKIWDQQAP